MATPLRNAIAATILACLSLYLWRIAYSFSDWAVLGLMPLTVAICLGFWPLTLDPWRAQLHLSLRKDSGFGKLLTGKIRATLLSGSFTFVAITLMAWQAIRAPITEASIMLLAFFLSACIFSTGQRLLERYFHQPFARSWATSVVTWVVALPFTLVLAISTWARRDNPGPMLNADFHGALEIGLSNLPARDGWVTCLLVLPYGYEAAKLWVVVQLYNYPVLGALFSLDAALISFVICRSAIVVTQAIETHFSEERK